MTERVFGPIGWRSSNLPMRNRAQSASMAPVLSTAAVIGASTPSGPRHVPAHHRMPHSDARRIAAGTRAKLVGVKPRQQTTQGVGAWCKQIARGNRSRLWTGTGKLTLVDGVAGMAAASRRRRCAPRASRSRAGGVRLSAFDAHCKAPVRHPNDRP